LHCNLARSQLLEQINVSTLYLFASSIAGSGVLHLAWQRYLHAVSTRGFGSVSVKEFELVIVELCASFGNWTVGFARIADSPSHYVRGRIGIHDSHCGKNSFQFYSIRWQRVVRKPASWVD
jgi:hypothetical protein